VLSSAFPILLPRGITRSGGSPGRGSARGNRPRRDQRPRPSGGDRSDGGHGWGARGLNRRAAPARRVIATKLFPLRYRTGTAAAFISPHDSPSACASRGRGPETTSRLEHVAVGCASGRCRRSAARRETVPPSERGNTLPTAGVGRARRWVRTTSATDPHAQGGLCRKSSVERLVCSPGTRNSVVVSSIRAASSFRCAGRSDAMSGRPPGPAGRRPAPRPVNRPVDGNVLDQTRQAGQRSRGSGDRANVDSGPAGYLVGANARRGPSASSSRMAIGARCTAAGKLPRGWLPGFLHHGTKVQLGKYYCPVVNSCRCGPW